MLKLTLSFLALRIASSVAVYENNPFLTGVPALANETSDKPKDINQWNVAVILPPGNHLQSGQPPAAAAPGFVWLQVPVSQLTNSSGVQNPPEPQQSLDGIQRPQGVQIGQGIPPNQLLPENSVPAQTGGSPQSPLTGGDLNKNCLTPKGQFPSTSCNKFINCWDGVATEQDCPGGLLFNPKGFCDYPENVNCNGQPIQGSTPVTASPGEATISWTSTPSSTSPSQSITPTTLGVIPTTLSPVPIPTIATLRPVDPALRKKCLKPRGQFPSITCNRYVNCWDDTIMEEECPEGLLFSSKGYCDYPRNVNCGDRGVISKSDISTECPLPFGTFRDRHNCSSYFRCISNKIVAKFECPAGFNFNDNIGVCDYENRVDCSHEPLIFETKSNLRPDVPNYEEIHEQSECPVDFGTFRDNTNCSTYYTCVSKRIVAKYDCPEGFSFNDDIGVCDYSDKVDCTQPPKIFQIKSNFVPQLPTGFMDKIDNCTPGSVLRLNPQCTAACLCRNGLAEIIQCPTGLAYDSTLDKCVLPHVARC